MPNTTNHRTTGPSNDDEVLQVIGWIFKNLFRTLWWSVLFPQLSLSIILASVITFRSGWLNGAIVLRIALVLLLCWQLAYPQSFIRLTWLRIHTRWRKWTYKRRWSGICGLHGFTKTLNGEAQIPVLRKVSVDENADVLDVAILPGQTPNDWGSQAEAFAHTFGALRVAVVTTGPAHIQLIVYRSDSLKDPVKFASPKEQVDLNQVQMGIKDDGSPWVLRLLGRHVLIAGATGSGKGSVLWSLLGGVAPVIRSGLVQVWAIDPKGGMELGAGAALFSHFSTDNGEHNLELLRGAARILNERAERLRGVARQHEPSASEPMILLVIDELASLTAYQPDRKIRDEADRLLSLILSQGRAVCVNVVACVQDPSKEVLGMRQLFPTRVGLRLSEPSQVNMLHGVGAHERGAHCDRIPDSLPGIAYVTNDDTNEITRVRASHVTDSDIGWIAQNYAPAKTRSGGDSTLSAEQ